MSLRKLATTFIAAAIVAVSSSAAMVMETSAAVSPGQVLISDTQGIIWSYDLSDGELRQFAAVTGSNFDITYNGPNELLIANIGDPEEGLPGAIFTLDTVTLEETEFFADDAVPCPISTAVTPRQGGTVYVADLCNQSLYEVPRGATVPRLLAEVGDNVEVSKQGLVYFAGGDTFGRLDPDANPPVVEPITRVDGAWLNGFALTPRGTAYITDSAPQQPAVYEVDATTGEVLATYTSADFRNPEDVAIAPNGDVYVVDSAFTQDPENYVPGLYRIPADGGNIETLYQGDPLGDPVDILLTPFRGF